MKQVAIVIIALWLFGLLMLVCSLFVDAATANLLRSFAVLFWAAPAGITAGTMIREHLK